MAFHSDLGHLQYICVLFERTAELSCVIISFQFKRLHCARVSAAELDVNNLDAHTAQRGRISVSESTTLMLLFVLAECLSVSKSKQTLSRCAYRRVFSSERSETLAHVLI